MHDSTTTSTDFEYRFRAPYGTPEERGAPPPVYSRSIENGTPVEPT